MILEGLLYINDKDVYTTYKAFLCEDKDGDFSNYAALLKPPAMKPYTSVATREIDGEKLPQTLTPAIEPRDVVLQFALCAPDKASFISAHRNFIDMLRSGWLNFYLPELNKIYKMVYLSCTDYSQLTPFAGEVAAKFKVKFREPKPVI